MGKWRNRQTLDNESYPLTLSSLIDCAGSNPAFPTMKHTLQERDELEADLKRSKERYAELEEKGIKALSDYDINIAHGGDAESALATAKMLVGNHIKYYERKLAELPPTLF